MSSTITSQPQYSNFSYSESVIDSTLPPSAAAYSNPEVSSSAAILDSLAPLQEIFVKHVLLYRDGQAQPEFLPSEYHVMTPDGQSIFLGKEENPRLNGGLANTRFFNVAGQEVMTFGLVTTLLNPCSGEEQRKPVMTLTSQGRDLGKINQRKMTRCGDVDVVYEDEYGRESPYSFTVISGMIALKDGYEIKENGMTVGTILPIVYEHIYGRGPGRVLANFKINFPPGMTDAKQKAAIIAAVVRVDYLYCSSLRRTRGRMHTVRLFGGKVTPEPH